MSAKSHPCNAVQPRIITPLLDVTLRQGESHSFVCAAVANPRAVFVFRLDGERITFNSSKHTLFSNSTHGTLTVLNLQGSDEGIYTCSAANRYGTVSTAAALEVQGVLELLCLHTVHMSNSVMGTLMSHITS